MHTWKSRIYTNIYIQSLICLIMANLKSNHAFTIEYNSRVAQLLTACWICESFNPSLLNGKTPPPMNEFMGLWDTGATGTVISKDIVAKLGLQPTGKVLSYHANGCSTVNTYMINISLPNNLAFHSVTVSVGDLNGFDVLIGMDIISLGDFSISAKNGNTIFSFRIPSVGTIDFVQENEDAKKQSVAGMNINPIVKQKKIQPNDPCPCLSGKKYKKCGCGLKEST